MDSFLELDSDMPGTLELVLSTLLINLFKLLELQILLLLGLLFRKDGELILGSLTSMELNTVKFGEDTLRHQFQELTHLEGLQTIILVCTFLTLMVQLNIQVHH